MKNSLQTAQTIAKLAGEKKGEGIVILDMRRVSGLCDYFVICEAASRVRAKTIAEHIQDGLKREGSRAVHREGLQEGAWIILDFSDVIVHIFQPEVRRHYNLEELWGDAPRRIGFAAKKTGSAKTRGARKR